MERLNKIERIRLSEQDVENLRKLGKKKSQFIRQAIREKIIRDKPKIAAEQKRKEDLIICPF